ncbi:MAG: RpiB/LacA/LacB family sugar-phosphate isomerase [Mycoplasmoidaceae bacterium]|nr:RpiB/LacA/LacB family sugar-phosphate isomerase [Mycoplasmoidaceae bacterium]
MYLSKHKGIVVAEINDEHSARMTTEHNNSSILTFGTKISTVHQMKKMIDKFLAASYEGGRHKVRIDMMDTLLEKEGK